MKPVGDIAADGWFRLDVAVRFRDLDPMGHAHHSLPLIYLEEARAAFWRTLRGSELDDIDYVMAEVTTRFHARIRYPSTLTVQLAVSRVGRSSFGTEFEIRDERGAVVASGSAVQVCYDYGGATSKPLDPALRDALLAWQAGRQKSSAMPAETVPIRPPST
jgi:acyl-CoA thioester hydrolase